MTVKCRWNVAAPGCTVALQSNDAPGWVKHPDAPAARLQPTSVASDTLNGADRTEDEMAARKAASEIYDPVPMPPDAEIQRAAQVLFNLAEAGGENQTLCGWQACFKSRTLEFVGVWRFPCDESLDEIQADVPHWVIDNVDYVGSMQRMEERAALEIRHAIERRNLSNIQIRQALEISEREDER